MGSDEVIMKLSQTGPVTSLSFSSDSDLEANMLLSCDSGCLLFWDLDKSTLLSRMNQPHHGLAIQSAQFLEGEPIVISSSEADNSLKMWYFDKTAGMTTTPRLLKERSGHSDSPHLLDFYGQDG